MSIKFVFGHFAACVLATLISTTALAGSAADGVAANDPYVRMVPPGMSVSGAFMILKNTSSKDHKLLKVDSQIAQAVELHTHTNDGGVMRMRQVKEIAIKSKGETALKPGGLHVMLIGLKQDLHEGDNVALTLSFEDGSSKKIIAPVRKIQAEMPMQHNHDGMKQ